MSQSRSLDREEYIEQAYFFRNLRERIAENRPAQEVLASIDQEILSTTRLPLAIQFLATDLKHTGLLSSGFSRLTHYFAPFQAFVICGTEHETGKFSIETALLVLEREAMYRAEQVSRPGLFVYQFEVLCRNRLGYDEGMASMAADPFYDDDWRAFIENLPSQIGLIDLSDLIYLRSELYLQEQCRMDPDYESPLPPLFGEKEGKIAKANRQRDPLYFFAALQRQLNYPEVPRYKRSEDTGVRIEGLHAKIRELEGRLRLLDAEHRGRFEDPKELGRPQLLDHAPELDIT